MKDNPDRDRGGGSRLGPLHPSNHNIGPDMEQPYAEFDEDWWTDTTQRYRAMRRAAYWTFIPHNKNSATRKIVTTTLMSVWAIITIGTAFGYADTSNYYPYISMLVFAIVCTIWGFEMGMIENVTGGPVPRREDDDDE